MPGPRSGALIHRVRTRLTVDLHPSKLASVDAGMHDHLNGLLLRYNADLEGVVLAYADEKVMSQAATVHPYFPLVRLTVGATLTVFRPLPGARLVGMVNKLSDDFIGLVVLGFVNVVVRAGEVRRELRPLPGGGGWGAAGAPQHTIRVGEQVAFRVKETRHEGAFLTLVGSLRAADTGAVAAVGAVAPVEEASAEAEGEGKKKKKMEEGKRKKGAEAAAAAAAGNGAAAAEDGGKKKKRRKEGAEEEEKPKTAKKEKKEKKKKGEK